jgi:hypothetical protein
MEMENAQYADVGAWEKYAVNRRGQYEVLKQPLYDYQAYAAAGQAQLTFFALPQGQGGKTLADTNMEAAGQLPNPKRFLIRGIEIQFFPGTLFPSGAPATASTIDGFTNDVWEVFSSAAWLELYIGSKAYVQAPLNMFPPVNRLAGWAGMSDGNVLAALGFNRTSYASASGTPFAMDPPLILEPTQNFKVTLNWPAAVAITNAGRIGIHLKGLLYRQSQ